MKKYMYNTYKLYTHLRTHACTHTHTHTHTTHIIY